MKALERRVVFRQGPKQQDLHYQSPYSHSDCLIVRSRLELYLRTQTQIGHLRVNFSASPPDNRKLRKHVRENQRISV